MSNLPMETNLVLAKYTKPTWFIDGGNRGEPTYKFKHLGHVGTVVRGDGYYVAELDYSGRLGIESVDEAKKLVETWLEKLIKSRIETAQAWLSQYTTTQENLLESPVSTPDVATPAGVREFKGSIRTSIDGSQCAFEFEVDANATDEEIEQVARESAFDNIEWSYKEVIVEHDMAHNGQSKV